jgi:CBS-domain-containing membrane protein
MMVTRTLHPPAGANAIIVFLAKPGWSVFLGSTFTGAVALIAFAALYHRATGRHKYPVTRFGLFRAG